MVNNLLPKKKKKTSLYYRFDVVYVSGKNIRNKLLFLENFKIRNPKVTFFL